MSDIRLGAPSGDPALLDGCQGVLGELVDGENLLPPPGMNTYSVRALSVRFATLSAAEDARVGTGQTIRESEGVELRDLLGWLVPPGDAGIELRWTLRALTVRVPWRAPAAGHEPPDLLQWSDPTVKVSVPAIDGAPAEALSAAVVLDDNAGWILADIHFGTPEAPDRDQAMRVMSALKTSAVTVTFGVTHSWRTSEDRPTIVLPKFEWVLSKEVLTAAINPGILAALTSLRTVAAVTPAPVTPAPVTPAPVTPIVATTLVSPALTRVVATPIVATAATAARATRVAASTRFLRPVSSAVLTEAKLRPVVRIDDLKPIDPVETPPADPSGGSDGSASRMVSVTYPLSVAQSEWGEVFADLDQGDRWRLTTVTVGGRSVPLWYRPADNKIGEYFYLPTAYRLGFLPVDGLPALRSRLVASEAGFRVQVSLAAVPVVDPPEREALRRWLSADRGLPYVSLQFPRGVAARLMAAAIGDAGALVLGEGVPVDSERGFLLDLDVPADRYDVVCAVLRSAMGIHGQVVFSASEAETPTVNVEISLGAVAPRPLAVALSFGMVLELTNVTTNVVELAGLSAWWVHSGTSGIHDGVAAALSRMVGEGPEPYDGVTPLRIEAGETVRIRIELETRPSETWKARVELGAMRFLDVDPNGWLEEVNRQEASPAATKLDVVVSGLDAPELVGVAGAELRLVDTAGVVVASGAVTAAAPRWVTEVQRALSDWASGNGGLGGLSLEVRTTFVDPGLGLPQRFVFAAGDTSLAVRVAGVETTTCDYEVTEIVGGDAQPPQTLPRVAVTAVLDGLRARNSGWRLRVVAPVVTDPVVTAPVEPVITEPVVTDPVVTAQVVPTVAVQIVPTLLDFETDLKLVIVQVSWADPVTGLPASRVVQFGKALGNTTEVVAVAVPVVVGGSLKYEVKAEYIALDAARNARMATTSFTDTLLLLERPGG